jgi:hypothetical protein
MSKSPQCVDRGSDKTNLVDCLALGIAAALRGFNIRRNPTE